VNKASVTARLREARAEYFISGAQDAEGEEIVALDRWLALTNQVAELKKRLRDAEATLDAAAYACYPRLTEAEIKALVVDGKWLASLEAAIHGEMDRISQALAAHVKELGERYETPLPQVTNHVAELEARVNRHLERMGFAINQNHSLELRSL